jgi:hypothetical protein
MIIHREIGSSYHHKLKVQGVDYPPLMVESKEEALVKEKRRPEAILAAVPPPIFAGSSSISWFRVSLPPPRENASEGILYLLIGGTVGASTLILA